MKLLIIAIAISFSVPSSAQDAPATPAPLPTISGTASDPAPVDQLAALYKWVKAQQANAGISYDLHRVKYACTWWDLISLGSSGLNVGSATSKDFLDLGPATAAANAAPTRYGQGSAVHVGNIWNAFASSLPGAIVKHVKITSLPDVTVGGLFFVPTNGVLRSWTWKNDFQGAVAYRFGGSSN